MVDVPNSPTETLLQKDKVSTVRVGDGVYQRINAKFELTKLGKW